MTKGFNLRRIAAAGLTAMLCAALAACFVLPGKFAETLDVRKDGRFSYSYKGEIVVLGLTKLMGMANAMGLGALGAMVTADKAAKDAGSDEASAPDRTIPPFPTMDGTFTLTTDAEVLANNTDDGPQANGTGKRLVWKLNVRNATPPTALLQLAQ